MVCSRSPPVVAVRSTRCGQICALKLSPSSSLRNTSPSSPTPTIFAPFMASPVIDDWLWVSIRDQVAPSSPLR